MKPTIGVGVIGMGWMGEVHSRAYNQIKNRFFDADFRSRLVICADNVEARARQAQERFGFEECASDWRAVIDHPEVEVVDVTAPNGMHIEAYNFLKSIASDKQGEPGFRQAYDIAQVQQTIIRSWDSERWETVAYEE